MTPLLLQFAVYTILYCVFTFYRSLLMGKIYLEDETNFFVSVEGFSFEAKWYHVLLNARYFLNS